MGVLLLKVLILSLILLSFCTHVFFQPSRYLYSRPEDLNLKYENRVIESKDGTRLHSWFFPSEGKSKGLAVLFHGNAQNLSAHYLALSWMVRYNYDVWVWDYRGYGLSQGEAGSEGIYEDSLVALDYAHQLMEKNYEKDSKLIVVGQSLGGNLLMRALEDFKHRERINFLVLDSTFKSYKELARDKLASVWFFWPFQHLSYALISDEYAPNERLKEITIPTLVIHGRQDDIIPFSYGREVYESIGPEGFKKKWFWALEEGKHISTLGSGKGGYDKKLIDLIEEAGKSH